MGQVWSSRAAGRPRHRPEPERPGQLGTGEVGWLLVFVSFLQRCPASCEEARPRKPEDRWPGPAIQKTNTAQDGGGATLSVFWRARGKREKGAVVTASKEDRLIYFLL